ncbi:uncharacterized protein A1O9_09576 [Exophiala aquamarina CBS 119918]|uniref:D-lactate dehydratase n=1 Tax=Exophiala aquamarina CBS 119918 TaxID=1182545 RepID=A0A072PFU0_9EURO|nr:uncharacterized protein A1O9_09576 [Exophiala aquamarina CBS 119918]KEF54410.1 hypothetical protein A1O9_09576 [Exophiala aquamarina CBS 119918]
MSSTKPKVLMVLTSNEHGWYLPELVYPYEILAPYTEITVASHLGGESPLDQSSVAAFKDDEMCARFVREKEGIWKNTPKLEDLVPRAKEFDVLFYVGGYGPTFDVIDSEATIAFVDEFYRSKKIICGICHGAAVFAHRTIPGTTKSILEGHRVTGISDREVGILASSIEEPFSVEGELVKAGAKFEKAVEPFGGHVVVSSDSEGRVFVTGQNPASGIGIGKAIYQELFKKPYQG